MSYKRPTAADRDAWLKEKRVLTMERDNARERRDKMEKVKKELEDIVKSLSDAVDQASREAKHHKRRANEIAAELNAAREFIKQTLRHF